MTREEFNKLSQEDRLNLVGEKWFSLYNNDKKYGWTIERSYRTDDEGKKHLMYECSFLNVELPYKKYFNDLNVHLGKEKDDAFHICYRAKNDVLFTLGNIPNGFLEEAYFFDFPESSINEYIDEYQLDFFAPFEKQYTDYRSVEEICKKKETKSRPKWFGNPKTLTKVNITLICIAALITLINVLVFL